MPTKLTKKTKVVMAWGVIKINLMTPILAGYAYSIYPQENIALNVAESWSKTSGRTYKVVPVTITYSLPATNKKRK